MEKKDYYLGMEGVYTNIRVYEKNTNILKNYIIVLGVLLLTLYFKDN